MSSLEHSFRSSTLTRTWTLRLDGDTLSCSGRRDVDLRDVQRVSLLANPVYGHPSLTHRQCKLKVSGRQREIYIQSLHPLGVGEYEDRSDTYGPLVAALCQRIARLNANAEFVSGSTGFKLMFYIMAGLSGVFGALMMIGGIGERDAEPIFAAALLLFAAYITFSIGRSLTRDTFDPSDPPDLGPFVAGDLRDEQSGHQ